MALSPPPDIAASSSLWLIELGLVILLGLALGSFATALIHRIPLGVSWMTSKAANNREGNMRSACPKCHHTLGILDLIPVFSWLCLKGSCRHCKSKIPIIYPLSELTVLCACLGIFAVHGLNIPALIMIFTMPFLIALLVIDLKYMILPNQLVAICAAFGAALLFYKALNTPEIEPLFAYYGSSAAIFALFSWVLGKIMTKILRQDALGFGDVKFFAVAGLWLGLANLPVFCILSGFFGAGISIMQRKVAPEEGGAFPFGPALIISFYLLLLIPEGYFF